MTFTPTNRPVPSDAPEDLYFNSSKLDEAVNSSEKTFTDRNGVERRTIKGMEGLAQEAIDAAILSTKLYPDTATGLAATANGEYFSIVSTLAAGYIDLYRKESGVAVFKKTYPSSLIDSLTVNRGKVYPLRLMTRNSITSAEPVAFSKAILSISILGARAGKFYRLAYFVNGSTAVPGAKPDGWIIEELDQANYATAANVATRVIDIIDATTPTIPRDGIQSVTLASTVVPDLRVLITLDTAELPAYGTQIASNGTAQAGYSYIIDPSRYTLSQTGTAINSININAGQVVPFRSVSRGGVVSATSPLQTNVILNARVINAKPGRYYGLRYFQNGDPTLVPAADGWIIEEVLIAGYDASTITTANTIAGLTDAQPAIDRTLGVQTVLLNTKSDVRIELTLDASKLSAYGTRYAMNAPGQAGYSQVLDPACYESPLGSSAAGSRVNYQMSLTQQVTVSWSDGTGTRGFLFGPNGANNLPNFVQVLKDGVVVSSFATDWLPPITFETASAGDGRVPLEFTGGNHLIDGATTASNLKFVVEADGVPLVAGNSGTADKITCRIVNRLMANNTVSLGRYALMQSFQVDFLPGVVNVHCEVAALENLQLYIDYGCQIVTTAVNDTLFYLDGQYATPIVWDGDAISGNALDYPNAWAVLTTSTNGQLVAWMDRSYGITFQRYVDPIRGLIRGGGSSSTKQYTTAYNKWNVRGPSNLIPLNAGEKYQWRGGYSWGPLNTASGFVASMRYLSEGQTRRVDVISAQLYLNP